MDFADFIKAKKPRISRGDLFDLVQRMKPLMSDGAARAVQNMDVKGKESPGEMASDAAVFAAKKLLESIVAVELKKPGGEARVREVLTG